MELRAADQMGNCAKKNNGTGNGEAEFSCIGIGRANGHGNREHHGKYYGNGYAANIDEYLHCRDKCAAEVEK